VGAYRVDPNVLAEVDSTLAEAARHAQAELRGLQSAAQAMLDTWQGSAGVAFRQGWETWHAGALDLLAALEDMGRALGVSSRGYAGNDDQVRTSMFSSVSS
jgi:WXG100 family type VII secretion target